MSYCRPCKQGNADTAVPLLQRALAILEKNNKDDPDIAGTLILMAKRHTIRDEYDQAEPELMRALAIREKAFGPESAEAADLLDSLGCIHTAQASPCRAEGQTKPDPDAPPALLTERSNFDLPGGQATVDGKTKGELKAERHGKKAEQFYRRALAIREKLLKPSDPQIAESLFRLGQLASVQERLGDAEGYLTRWLTSQQSTKAPPSRDQAEAFYTLAEASRQRKDWAEADHRLASAQSILEKIKGAEGDDLASILSQRAELALQAGHFDDAEKLLRRDLRIRAALYGPNDPDIIEAQELMAGSYQEHVEDRRAPLIWRQLRVVSHRTDQKDDHWKLGEILDDYTDLLRRTNRLLLQPTEEDLAYLKKAGVVLSDIDLELLVHCQSSFHLDMDDQGLATSRGCTSSSG